MSLYVRPGKVWPRTGFNMHKRKEPAVKYKLQAMQYHVETSRLECHFRSNLTSFLKSLPCVEWSSRDEDLALIPLLAIGRVRKCCFSSLCSQMTRGE